MIAQIYVVIVVYNVKVVAYQIVLHHCAKIIPLNQMI